MVVDRRNDTMLRVAAPVNRIVIGATRNWSKNVLLWNLAADPKFEPHTNNGGCGSCEGAITLDGNTVTRTWRTTRSLRSQSLCGRARYVWGRAQRRARWECGVPYCRRQDGAGGGEYGAVGAGVCCCVAWKDIYAMLPAGAVATYVW